MDAMIGVAQSSVLLSLLFNLYIETALRSSPSWLRRSLGVTSWHTQTILQYRDHYKELKTLELTKGLK